MIDKTDQFPTQIITHVNNNDSTKVSILNIVDNKSKFLIESDKTTSIYNVSTRVLNKK